MEDNSDRLGGDLAARTHRARVREDFLSGVESGVNGTPTFFINGVRHDGGYVSTRTAGPRGPAVVGNRCSTN